MATFPLHWFWISWYTSCLRRSCVSFFSAYFLIWIFVSLNLFTCRWFFEAIFISEIWSILTKARCWFNRTVWNVRNWAKRRFADRSYLNYTLTILLYHFWFYQVLCVSEICIDCYFRRQKNKLLWRGLLV